MPPSTVPITLTYKKRGTQPPIFVAGTFTNPPWDPQEMECVACEDGEHMFAKACEVDPSKDVQYKFRIGLGDWWVTCEDSPMAVDTEGNANNVMKPCVDDSEEMLLDDLDEQGDDVEVGSTTNTEQSEEIPSPSDAPRFEAHVIVHDEALPEIQQHHEEETSTLSKSVDSEVHVFPHNVTPPCPPIEAKKSVAKPASAERDGQVSQGESAGVEAESHETQEGQGEELQEAELLSEDAAASETDGQEARLLRRRREPQQEAADLPLPAKSVKRNLVAAFFYRLVNFVGRLLRGVIGRKHQE